VLGDEFSRYLKKVNVQSVYPLNWDSLKSIVEQLTGSEWNNPKTIITKLKRAKVESRSAIVHGDLHSQNILVDQHGEPWPIDFAWCREKSTPLLDFTMLECSLKFLGIPQRADLHDLITLDSYLVKEAIPEPHIGRIPYADLIGNVMKSILAVRRIAIEDHKITFSDYLKALCLMTYCHSTHPKLNRPLVLASLQMLCDPRNQDLSDARHKYSS
jgi:hypothetical protein